MKVNVSRKQIIACVLIVLFAAVVGAVGLYGLSGRASDAGVKMVQDMQPFSIPPAPALSMRMLRLRRLPSPSACAPRAAT